MKDIDEMSTEQLKRELKDCRNELCYHCGRYKERHLGRCDGCRWMDEPETEEL